MEGIREEDTEETAVVDMDTLVKDMVETAVEDTVETMVVDMVVKVDMEDVEEDTVATAAATEATVTVRGAVLMLVKLFKLSLLTKNHACLMAARLIYMKDTSCCGCDVSVCSQIKGNYYDIVKCRVWKVITY
uniref:Uncharacterized protein n=1 Tax=Noccaea caerulescens TaxID=107243 RepID=A0A1J3JM18_NOCCA